MNLAFSPDQFPSRARLVSASWAPILFAPNPDTPERLVIAVVAVGTDDFYVAPANSAKRLSCLYGPAASTALMVQEATVRQLREDLAIRGLAAIESPEFLFAGVSLGVIRAGEAENVHELASRWLEAISSIHVADRSAVVEVDEPVQAAVAAIEAQTDNDRLPVLVYKAVEEADPDLGSFFSADIRSRARKAPRPAPQKVFIGFAGSNVVANFATLRPSTRPRGMIDHIKRLMWDLAQHQDDEANRISRQRSHEMIVFSRDSSDPEIDDQKATVLLEMMEDLKEQGAKDEISVQQRSSVGSIADHVRIAERTAVPL